VSIILIYRLYLLLSVNHINCQLSIIFIYRFLIATHSSAALPPSQQTFKNSQNKSQGFVEDFEFVRAQVIDFLLESLNNSELNVKFFELCSYQVILTLLQTNHGPTQLTFLRLLKVCFI
jgi:hypothetical protein